MGYFESHNQCRTVRTYIPIRLYDRFFHVQIKYAEIIDIICSRIMMERNTTHEKRIVWGKPKSILVTYYQSWIPAIHLKNLDTGACGIRGVFRGGGRTLEAVPIPFGCRRNPAAMVGAPDRPKALSIYYGANNQFSATAPQLGRRSEDTIDP